MTTNYFRSGMTSLLYEYNCIQNKGASLKAASFSGPRQ